MGPSGSGKSTSMNIIGCLDVPTRGEYGFHGVDASGLDRSQPRDAAQRLCIGFVFQGYNLLPRTTAVENVELPLIYRGVPASERRASCAMKALAQVGLDGRETPYAGGAFRRPAAARGDRARHRHPP
jgi:putative ABC transport system ATP-binding protein